MPAPTPQSQPPLAVSVSDFHSATQSTALERDMAVLQDELGKFWQDVQEELLANNKRMHDVIHLQHLMAVSFEAAFANLVQKEGEPVPELTEEFIASQHGCCIGNVQGKREEALIVRDDKYRFTMVKEEIERILRKFNHGQVQQAPDEESQKIDRTEEEEEASKESGKATQELQEHEQQKDIDGTNDTDSYLNTDPAPKQTRSTLQMVEELQDELNHTYTLDESMWDVVMLVGMPHLGIFDNIILGLIMWLNITVQAVFCIICWRAFTDSDIDSESIFSLKVWRWYFAHDVSHVNQLWPMSLASRVCEHDASLILSGHQADLSSVIERYRPDVFHNVGQLMCLLCLIIFWTKLWSEAKKSIRFMTAAITISGKVSSIHTTLEGIKLASISYWRVTYVAVIFALRMTILVNLAAVVTIWLSNTTSLGDLLLNALALELVLDVDELLFAGLAPAKTTVFVRNLQPLPLWATKQHDIDLTAIAGICAMFIAAPTVYYSLLANTLELVNQADTALCQGATNFAYNVDQLGIVYVHDGMMTPSAKAFSEEGFDQSDTRIQLFHFRLKMLMASSKP